MQTASEQLTMSRLGPESYLSAADPLLAKLISGETARWPLEPTEHPIWGLLRIVMAQQMATSFAARIAQEVATSYPRLKVGQIDPNLDTMALRKMGLSERRAICCCSILQEAGNVMSKVEEGTSWEQAVAGIKGIGPWTIAVFRIMVLREPDVLVVGDVGLNRAITNIYGQGAHIEEISEKWRPFRSVASWYLWRTLGNQQLG